MVVSTSDGEVYEDMFEYRMANPVQMERPSLGELQQKGQGNDLLKDRANRGFNAGRQKWEREHPPADGVWPPVEFERRFLDEPIQQDQRPRHQMDWTPGAELSENTGPRGPFPVPDIGPGVIPPSAGGFYNQERIQESLNDYSPSNRALRISNSPPQAANDNRQSRQIDDPFTEALIMQNWDKLIERLGEKKIPTLKLIPGGKKSDSGEFQVAEIPELERNNPRPGRIPKEIGGGGSVSEAAIQYKGKTYTGNSHYEAFEKIPNFENIPSGKFKEGFMTSKGTFVSRQEAAEIAKNAGQIDKLAIPEMGLMSEELPFAVRF